MCFIRQNIINIAASDTAILEPIYKESFTLPKSIYGVEHNIITMLYGVFRSKDPAQ